MHPKKIGIMGGTFDPIHVGHLILAETARDYFSLDEILFIPSGSSYMKECVTDKYIRLQMVSLAIEDHPDFALSDMEVNRVGNSYSYETLQQLKEIHPENTYYFIVGADSIFNMESWKKIDILFKNCIVAVAVREGYSVQELETYITTLTEKYEDCQIQLFATSRVDISSTDIRKRVFEGHSTRYMVPDKVLSYIKKNHIYRNDMMEQTNE